MLPAVHSYPSLDAIFTIVSDNVLSSQEKQKQLELALKIERELVVKIRKSCLFDAFCDTKQIVQIKVKVAKIHNKVHPSLFHLLPQDIISYLLQYVQGREYINFRTLCSGTLQRSALYHPVKLRQKAATFGLKAESDEAVRLLLSKLKAEVALYSLEIPASIRWVSMTKGLNELKTLANFKLMTTQTIVDFHHCCVDLCFYRRLPRLLFTYLLRLSKENPSETIFSTRSSQLAQGLNSMLLFAAMRQDWTVAELALLHGANPNAHWRLSTKNIGFESVVNLLLTKRNRPDGQLIRNIGLPFRKHHHLTALYYAYAAESQVGIELLLRYGAINQPYSPFNLVHAVRTGSCMLVNWLIQQNASSHLDPQIALQLFRIAEKRSTKMVDLLTQLGVPRNHDLTDQVKKLHISGTD